MKLTKSQLKRIIKEELRKVLNEDMNDPSCLKQVAALKNDGYYPLKSAHFWNAKGEAVKVFQRNDDLKPGWYINKTKADDKELLAAALSCLKNKCARGSKVKIKSDRRIKMMAAKALTKEDVLEAFIACN
jgi:hypothetical protein